MIVGQQLYSTVLLRSSTVLLSLRYVTLSLSLSLSGLVWSSLVYNVHSYVLIFNLPSVRNAIICRVHARAVCTYNY